MNDYYKKKAIKAKKCYDKGIPLVKVYASVRDGDKFIVLKKRKDNKVTYHLAGGGVDDGETLEEAIKREILEELNVEVEIIKKLGVYDKLYVPWKLDGEEFKVQYEIHVFDTKVIRKVDGEFGLEGEFNKEMQIDKIDKETLVNNIAEFNSFKIKIE